MLTNSDETIRGTFLHQSFSKLFREHQQETRLRSQNKSDLHVKFDWAMNFFNNFSPTERLNARQATETLSIWVDTQTKVNCCVAATWNARNGEEWNWEARKTEKLFFFFSFSHEKRSSRVLSGERAIGGTISVIRTENGRKDLRRRNGRKIFEVFWEEF